MLDNDIVRCQIHIVPYHLQSGVPEYLLQGEYITSINQEPYGKRMPAKMGMKPLDSRSLG
jgi:hypothetical protein